MISVIVPIYNVEKYVNKCVGSIVNQTYTNLEIILVDDGSPDRCPEICDEWAKKDSRIKVIHKKNGGLSDARNAGMKIASGDYIVFVDSDDWIAPEMYERLLMAIKNDNSDIAACAVKMVWEDGSSSKLLTLRTNCVLSQYEAQSELLSEKKLKQPVFYKLYRMENIRHIPFEKGKYHEDVFWSYQAIGCAKRVSLSDYIGYFYLQRIESIMGSGYSLKRLDAMEAYCNRYEYFKEYFPELQQKALCSIWENCIYHGQMAMTYLNQKDRRNVYNELRKIQKKYPIKYNDYADMRLSHKVWLTLSRISLTMVCSIKKSLRIGY